IVNNDSYYEAVVDGLRAAGFCAEREPYEPDTHLIHVKNINDFSEDFALALSSGYIRRDSYVHTCRPSSFPLESQADTPPPESGCGRPFPPPLWDFGAKVNTHGTEYSVLDSTPRVKDCNYCAAIGYNDGRCVCPLRVPGAY